MITNDLSIIYFAVRRRDDDYKWFINYILKCIVYNKKMFVFWTQETLVLLFTFFLVKSAESPRKISLDSNSGDTFQENSQNTGSNVLVTFLSNVYILRVAIERLLFDKETSQKTLAKISLW